MRWSFDADLPRSGGTAPPGRRRRRLLVRQRVNLPGRRTGPTCERSCHDAQTRPAGSTGRTCCASAGARRCRAGREPRWRASPSTGRGSRGRRRGAAPAGRRAGGATRGRRAGRAREGAGGAVRRARRRHRGRGGGGAPAAALPAGDRSRLLAGAGAGDAVAPSRGCWAHAGVAIDELRRELGLAGPTFETVFDPAGAGGELDRGRRGAAWRLAGGRPGSLRLRYRTDALDAACAARIAGYHLTALALIAADPDAEHRRAEAAVGRGAALADRRAGRAQRELPGPAGARAVRGAGGRAPGRGRGRAGRPAAGPTAS